MHTMDTDLWLKNHGLPFPRPRRWCRWMLLVKCLVDCKSEDVNGVGVVINFIGHRVQPIKDRVHPAIEYTGRGDLTRESPEPWEDSELYSQVVSLFSSDVDVLGAKRPKGYSLANPPDEVCLFLQCLIFSLFQVVLTRSS